MKQAFAWFGVLVLPLAILLFAQWPLREFVHAYSRQANDLAQVLFALYVAVAITAASHAKTHLAAGYQTTALDNPGPRWKQYAVLLCIAPWALLILWASSAQLWEAIVRMERFPETGNPAFFVIKFAAWLMPLLALVYCAFEAVRKH